MANEIPIDVVLRARDEMTSVLDDVIKSSGGVDDAMDGVRKSTDKAAKETDDFGKSAKDSAKDADSFSDKLKGLGSAAKVVAGAVAGAAAAAGAAIAAIGAAAIKTVNDANVWAGTLDGLGDVLGTTANESAALTVAIRGVGGNVDAVTGQMVKLTRGLEDNNGKASDTAKLMQSLGISYKNAKGEMLPASAIIENTANVIAKMPDGLEKTSIMTELFGRSGKDLGDTMAALANGGLDAAGKKAKEFGLLIGDEGVANSVEFGKKSAEMQMRLEGMSVMIGNTLMPAILPFLDTLNQLAAEYLPKVAAGIGPVIEAFIAFAKDNIPPLIEGLKTVVNWVSENWPTIQAVISTVFGSIKFVFENVLKPVIDFMIDIFADVGKNTSDDFSSMSKTINGVMKDIGDIIDTVLSTIAQLWNEYGDEILSFVRETWMTISDVINTTVAIVVRLIEIAMPTIKRLVDDTMDALRLAFAIAWAAISLVVGNALDILKTIVNVTLSLLNGDVDGALVALRDMFLSIWTRIYKTVKGLIEDVVAIIDDRLKASGTSIDGILRGVEEYFTTAWSNIYNTVEYWVNTIRNRASALFQEFKDDTILKFNEIKDAIMQTIRTAAQYWNTIAPFIGQLPITIPDFASRGGRGSNTGSGTNAYITVNVYGGDAATAERGVVAGLQRAGFAIVR